MRAILWPCLSSHADCLAGMLWDPPRQQGEEGKEGHRGSQVNMQSTHYGAFSTKCFVQSVILIQYAMVRWTSLHLSEGVTFSFWAEKCWLVQSTSTEYFLQKTTMYLLKEALLFICSEKHCKVSPKSRVVHLLEAKKRLLSWLHLQWRLCLTSSAALFCTAAHLICTTVLFNC